MKSYFVTWEIEIDADSPLEAAVIAREMQLDPESTANHFTVLDQKNKRVYEMNVLEARHWIRKANEIDHSTELRKYSLTAGAVLDAPVLEDDVEYITVEDAVIKIGGVILKVDAAGIGKSESRVALKDGLRMAANIVAGMKGSE